MLESLLCNSCGAPLEVPDSANFVKCVHCHSTLKVHRTESSITTEAIEKLAATTEDLAEQVEQLTRTNKLNDLDQQWAQQRQSFLISDKDGRKRLASKSSALAGGISAIVFGGIWTVFAVSMTSGAPDVGPFQTAKVLFPLFGIGIIAIGIFTAVSAYQKAEQYEAAERTYRRRRQKISKGDR